MRVCSFLPGATQIIYDLGLQHHLDGVTFECHSDKPKVVRSFLENKNYASQEIDKIVAESKLTETSLYYIEEDVLKTLSPDLIFTQDVCEVCQISTSQVQKAIAKLDPAPILVTLLPHNFADVLDNIRTIAGAMRQPKAADKLLNTLRERINRITFALETNQSPFKRVLILEWIDPMYNCGHWIPDQIKLAGGVDELSNTGGYSAVITLDEVLKYDPEIIIIAPCGFDPIRAASESEILKTKLGWSRLKAVQQQQVYFVDAQYFTQPSSTLVDGIELLAALFHPTLFSMPVHLKNAYLS